MSDLSPEIRESVRIANRFLASLSPAEQETALIALVQAGTQDEAQAANDVLFNKRELDRAQLTLRSILEGQR